MSNVSPDLNLIKLRWAGNYLDGTPCTGTVDLEYIGGPQTDDDALFPVSIYPTKIILTLAPMEVTVQDKDGNDVTLTVGYAELDVPASNDPDVAGSGGFYRMTERIHKGGGREKVDFPVDVDTPDAELWLNKIVGGTPGYPELPSPVYWSTFNALALQVEDLEDAPVKVHNHPIEGVVGLQDELDTKQDLGDYILEGDARLTNARVPTEHNHLWAQILGKPNTYPATTHGHNQSDITGLVAELAGKQSAGNYAAAIHLHDIDDVAGLQDALDAAGTGGGGGTISSDWADITNKPTEFTPTDHDHAIIDVTGLDAALAGKQPAGSYVSSSDLTTGLAGKQDAGDYVEDTDPRLSDARTPTAHSHSWTQVTDKPTTFAPATHSHGISDTSGLQAALDAKQATGDYATNTALTTGLAGKQASGDYVEEGDARLTDARTPLAHSHSWVDVSDKPATFTPSAHTHAWDDVTAKPASFPPSAHGHVIGDTTGLQAALDAKQASGSYATSSDLTTGLAGKAPTSHTHVISGVTGLQAALDAKQASGSYAPATHSHALADMPAGMMLFVKVATGSEARPSARTDLCVTWLGGATPPTNAIVGDVWLEDL